jgi:hypothetical protein
MPDDGVSFLFPLSYEEAFEGLAGELSFNQSRGLFLALYPSEAVKEAVIAQLREELPDHFQFLLQINDRKIEFSTFFSQTFEQTGEYSDIFHILGIEQLSEAAQLEFLGSLQYGRENFKSLGYTLVFWISPAFVIKLFHTAPDFYSWLNGTYDFSTYPPTGETTYARQRENFLGSVKSYLEKLIWQYEYWEDVPKTDFLLEVMSRANLRDYYVDLSGTDPQGKVWKLDELLDHFLDDPQQSFMTLLGDYGTGKSSFALHYFVQQARRYLQDNTQRIPLFISLKDYPKRVNVQTFLQKEFRDKFQLDFSLAVFQELALAGQFLFLVDGFDEMMSIADKQETMANFKALTRLTFENLQFMTQVEAGRKNKLLMTCRTHYFFSEAQEKEFLQADYTVLYRNYATKSRYQITRENVRKFDDAQIEEFISKNVGNEVTTQQMLAIIRDTYNLQELSERPLLLNIIVKTLPVLKEKEKINVAQLYRVYTDEWIERDDWRSQLTPQGKRQFMWELALKMYQGGGNFSLHYSQLDKPKAKFLKNPGEGREDYYAYETTTCAFLNRDAKGNYKFVHKSFMEYFMAERFMDSVKKQEVRPLDYKDINQNIRNFMKMMLSLEKNLSGADLVGFDLVGVEMRKVELRWADLRWTNLEGAELQGANLEGAELQGANLQGANLQGANLQGAKLQGVNLQGANFRGAKNLKWANLQGVKNLIRSKKS